MTPDIIGDMWFVIWLLGGAHSVLMPAPRPQSHARCAADALLPGGRSSPKAPRRRWHRIARGPRNRCRPRRCPRQHPTHCASGAKDAGAGARRPLWRPSRLNRRLVGNQGLDLGLANLGLGKHNVIPAPPRPQGSNKMPRNSWRVHWLTPPLMPVATDDRSTAIGNHYSAWHKRAGPNCAKLR